MRVVDEVIVSIAFSILRCVMAIGSGLIYLQFFMLIALIVFSVFFAIFKIGG